MCFILLRKLENHSIMFDCVSWLVCFLTNVLHQLIITMKPQKRRQNGLIKPDRFEVYYICRNYYCNTSLHTIDYVLPSTLDLLGLD